MNPRTQPAIIYGGVDGTYPSWDDDEYRNVFRYSFVHVLYNSWTYGPRHYLRGPTTADEKPADNTGLSALRTFEFVESNWKPDETAVFLAATAAAARPSSKWRTG